MTTLAPTALDAAIAAAYAQLDVHAPDLRDGFRDHLPRAVDAVARRLVGAAYREDLAGLRESGRLEALTAGATRHGFDRAEVALVRNPARILTELPARLGDGTGLSVELADAAVNLAIAYARQPDTTATGAIGAGAATGAAERTAATAATGAGALDAVSGRSPDDQAVLLERLSVEGHNLHPCGRTRLGWDVADVLAHDLEAGATTIGFVAVRRDRHVGQNVGALLGVPAPRPGYSVQAVHAWQLDRVVRRRYADLIGTGALVPLEQRVRAVPTAALRTLLLDGTPRRYLKVSLDIQVTSTRRTISVASTRNGPALSALLHRLLAAEPRVLLLAEEAGGAGLAGNNRDLAAIVRRGLDDRLAPDELPVPGGALYAAVPGTSGTPGTGGTVLAELVDRYATTRGLRDRAAAAAAFLDDYARLLLPPLLRLATRHGIGMEAHLQNCVPTFRDGVPHRLALRDFAGLRVHPPRLTSSVTFWPGSVIVTGEADVMRAKLGYTALQANLGELIVRLALSHGLDEPAAWRAVRAVVDDVYDDLRADPTVAAAAAADHAFLTAPLMPHKALVRMRLAAAGDVYVPVRNPLA
jgi:siderophore synthetase component